MEVKNVKEAISSLVEASKIIISILEIDKLLALIMEQAKGVVSASGSSLLLLDEQKRELIFHVALGEKGDKLRKIRLPEGEGIAWSCIKNDKAVIVNDVEKDPRWSSRGDQITEIKTKSILCVPLKIKERIIGAVEAINKLGDGNFTEDDAQILEAFASYSAVAIENARLFTDLKEEKERLEALFKNMADGVLIADSEYKIVLLNTVASSFLDIKQEKARGMSLEDALSNFESTIPISEIKADSSKVQDFELTRKMGKNLILGSFLTRIYDQNKRLSSITIIIKDITQQKRDAAASRNFLSLISHKLRTPMVSILGYVPLLLDEEDSKNLTPFQKQAIHTIGSEGQHLFNLLEELLAFTLIEDLSFKLVQESVKTKRLVDEAISQLKERIERDKVEVKVDESISSSENLLCNFQKTTEVFRNIIENAIKFNDKPDKKIEISCMPTDEKSNTIIIRDNGPGIPPEERAKVFAKFYQIDDDFTGQVEGSGLGLTFAKRILEAQGGRIWIEGDIDKETRVFFTLPKAPPAENR